MEKTLLNLKITRARSETAMRWIAMGIAATAEHERLARYAIVRDSIAEVIVREGAIGIDGEACVRKNMESLFRLVCELEAKGLGSRPIHACAA
jgi:hypothetical protein